MRKLINLFENDYDDKALLYENLNNVLNSINSQKMAEAVVFFKSEDILLKLFIEFAEDPSDDYFTQVEYNYDDIKEEKDYPSMIMFLLNDLDDTTDYESYITKLNNQISKRIEPLFVDNLQEFHPDQQWSSYQNREYVRLDYLNDRISFATRRFQNIYGNVNPLKHMSVADLLDFGKA